MYRTLLGILTVFAVALGLVALTFSASLEERADLRVANGTEPASLDPHLITGVPEHHLAMSLFEGLTRFDPKTLKPAPGVAASWDISLDGTTYTFKLRRDARWSDGRPITASDFTYSWKRNLEPSLGSEYAYMLFPVKLAEAYNTFAGHAEAIDKKILPALATLRGDLDAAGWQAFLRKNKVHDPLRPVEDAALVELLGRRSGRVSEAELAAFVARVKRARSWLVAEHAEALAHFGVDRGVIAQDPQTLVVELRAPTPYFLETLFHQSSMPVPRWVVEKVGPRWFLPKTFVSNGPFRLGRWLVNDHIRLERSPTYWGKNEVRLERVDMFSNDNQMSNVNRYLTGALDVVETYYPQELAHELKKRPDFQQAPGLIVYFYRFNVTRKPFDDVRVRRAFSLVVDRELITGQVLGLGQIPAYTLVPPGLPGYTSPESRRGVDVAEARRLLTEAGYPDGKGFPRVGLLYNTNEDHKRLAEVVADQIRRALGVEITAYNQEWQSFLETVRSMDFQMCRFGWAGDYMDPNTFVDLWITNGPNNNTGWSSALYDRLVRVAADVGLFLSDPSPLLGQLRDAEAIRTLIPKTQSGTAAERQVARERIRLHLLREAEAIVLDEQPFMPMYFYVNGGLIRPGVRGFEQRVPLADGTTGVNLQNLHPLRDVWVDRSVKGAP
jgi:oligopeptide transport system substrate-binding protein